MKSKKTPKQTYKEYALKRSTKSPIYLNVLRAFLGGGTTSLLGQALAHLYDKLGLSEDSSYLLASLSLIFVAIILTGVGVFDKIASFAGAGTLVPITGFANAMSSPAIDARSEGYVLGVGAKIFTVAGPVILYGTAASVLYGVIYWIVGRFVL